MSSVRIAMWSGPRNISTALMRSWGNRDDTFVCDEPFYAHYLASTGLDHPGAADVLAFHESDWRTVTRWLLGPIPDDKRIFYQKQMAHHLLPDIDLNWLDGVTNCFLIRDPSEMLTSLVEFLPEPTFEDTGLPQQIKMFHRLEQTTGKVPPVLDARDVLEDPRGMLSRLCAEVGVPFIDQMLSWPPGPRDTDGVWARHWYAKVLPTTKFAPYKPKDDVVPDRLKSLLDQCQNVYEKLYSQRLRVHSD